MKHGIYATLATILLAHAPAAAQVTLGVEWEMDQGVYNLDEDPADSGDTLFCSRETHNGYPLISVTSDISWAAVPNTRTLEFVTAPIVYSDVARWNRVLAFTQSFYNAVTAHCDANHRDVDTHCAATMNEILGDMNNGLDAGAELAVVDCKGIDQPRDGDRTGIVWAYEPGTQNEVPLAFDVGSTQVNVPIDLAVFGDDASALDVLFADTGPKNPANGPMYMAWTAYRESVTELAGEGGLTDAQRGFLALYHVGANVHANARARPEVRGNGQRRPRPPWTFHNKDAWWIKNWWDLFPKVQLNELYNTFSDDEKAQMAPFLATAGNGGAANLANTNLADRFCVVRDADGGFNTLLTKQTCRSALKSWAAKLRGNEDPLGEVYKPINIHRTGGGCATLDGRPVLFEMRGGAALNTTMTPVVGGGNVLAWPGAARAAGLPAALQ